MHSSYGGSRGHFAAGAPFPSYGGSEVQLVVRPTSLPRRFACTVAVI